MNWKEKLRIAWLLSSGEIKDFRPLEETVTEIIENLIEEFRNKIDTTGSYNMYEKKKIFNSLNQLKAKWLN